MPSADQVPTKLSHSTMLWHEWVVLIAGSTGSALRAVRPPNLHITPVVRRDFVYRASATGSLYRSPLAILCASLHERFIALRCGLVRRHDCAMHLSRCSIGTAAVALVESRVGRRHVSVSV